MKTRPTGKTVALQSWLRPALTHVGANKDYALFREQLEGVDALLKGSHLEAMAMDFARPGQEKAAIRALRVKTLRMLLGNPGFREFSRMVASSDLLADFCEARHIDGIRGVSKSALERASKFFTAGQVRWMQQVLTEMCGEADRAQEIGLPAPVDKAKGVMLYLSPFYCVCQTMAWVIWGFH